MSNDLVFCYNRGCGQKFNPNENSKESCTFHPGEPFFHDAYKGWSCCKRKCIDFTEFLNMKGCTTFYHNPDKPVEPEKPVVDKSKADEVIVYRAPERKKLQRPDFETPMVELLFNVAPELSQQVQTLQAASADQKIDTFDYPPSEGTSCKNNACKKTYAGPESEESNCQHHPGVPIFHEGAKFWSCCKKRTFDFDDFLNQEGCQLGKHCWHKKKEVGSQVKCRYDWHQTGSHVVVAIYAKKYDPSKSRIQLNPVHLLVELMFPEEGAAFTLDIELEGVVDVSRSTAAMMTTKVEIKLKKAEPGSWRDLQLPKTTHTDQAMPVATPKTLDEDLDAVDLSDL